MSSAPAPVVYASFLLSAIFVVWKEELGCLRRGEGAAGGERVRGGAWIGSGGARARGREGGGAEGGYLSECSPIAEPPRLASLFLFFVLGFVFRRGRSREL